MSDPLFSGSFEQKLDTQGRMSVPSSFRAQLAGLGQSTFFCYPSRQAPGVLECCDAAHMARMRAALNGLPPFNPTRRNLELRIFSRAREIAVDGKGRSVLPEELRGHAGLKEAIVFVGRGQLFEIWAQTDYAAFLAEPDVPSAEEDALFAQVWQATAGAIDREGV